MSDDEAALVRARILPPDGSLANAPVLICPDDLDLACTVVFAEVHRDGETVIWRRLGVERRAADNNNEIGKDMEWWPAPGPFAFPLADYVACLAAFEEDAVRFTP